MSLPHRCALVLVPALAAAAAAACTATNPGGASSAEEGDGASDGSASDPAAAARQALEERDFIQRLQVAMEQPKEDPAALLLSLERLLPAWESEQRRGRERPVENIVSLKVVANLDTVLDAFQRGSRDQQLVAAWALGFSRVPENDLGLKSSHGRALAALTAGLQTRDDALLRNELLALWKLRDTSTPLHPLLDLMVQHHEPDVRSNATLAVGAVLTRQTLPQAQDSLLVALSDPEARVRLHAATVARDFPSPAITARLLQTLAVEEKPLVRAAMAAALGAARSREATPMLLAMLGSNFEIEVATSRAALFAIYGEDRGPGAAAWADLLR